MKILIIDDDPIVTLGLNKFLGKRNHQCILSNEPVEALEIAMSQKFDLILCDIIMPYLSGVELMMKVKEKNNRIPFIIMSALTQKELILTTFELGAWDYLIKPLDLHILNLKFNHYEHSNVFHYGFKTHEKARA